MDSPNTTKTASIQQNEAEELKNALHEKAMQLLKKLPAFGPVILLYLQSSHRRFHFISDLEWLLIPPLVSGQCKLYMKKEYPFAYVSWAFLNEESEKILSTNGGRIRPEDWKSGDQLWIMDIVAPFGEADKMLADLQRNEFPDRTIRVLVPDPKTGGIGMRELKSYNETKAHQQSTPTSH